MISKTAGRRQANHSYNLVPFYSIWSYFTLADASGALGFVINILGKILVFMPVGMFVPCLFPKKTWAYKILSVGVFDVDDLILNTLGALIGWKLYKACLSFSRHRRSIKSHDFR